ncbi:MAG: LPS export ABC transporter periplasmic protein LptC [Saprospiraceae bacterium]
MKLLFQFLFFVSILATSCENDLAAVDALQDKLDTKVERVEEVEILYSDEAHVKVRITGPVMLNNLDRVEPFQEFIEGALVEFFDQVDTTVTSTLVADYAIRYQRRGEVVARDSVVWQSIEGQKLETEELIWSEKEARVYTRKFAKITTPTEIIYGHGFTANQDFTNARIQQVEGIITIDKPE